MPSISGTGNASASAPSGFTISVSGVEGAKLGLIFYGINNSGWTPSAWSPLSTSFLCVKPPTQRTFSQNSGGTTNGCDGTLSIDWNAFITGFPGALGTPFAGSETVYAQGWFSDRAALKKTNLSEYANPRKGGVIAIQIEEGDRLMGVKFTEGNNEIVLVTHVNNWWFRILDVTDDDIEQVLDVFGIEKVGDSKGIEHRIPNKNAGIDYAIASVYHQLVNGETVLNMMVRDDTVSNIKDFFTSL